MPTTQKLQQKSQQKHTKATQKVGGSAKKPVTKAMEGGNTKKPVTKAMGGGKGKVVAVKTKTLNKRGGVFSVGWVRDRVISNVTYKEIVDWLVSFLVKPNEMDKFIVFFDETKKDKRDDDLVYKKNGRLPAPDFNSLKLLKLIKDGKLGGYIVKDHHVFDNTDRMTDHQRMQNRGINMDLYNNTNQIGKEYKELIDNGMIAPIAEQAIKEKFYAPNFGPILQSDENQIDHL